MNERDLWWELGTQLEPLVTAYPDAEHELLGDVGRRVQDGERFSTLLNVLGLDEEDCSVGELRRHPHYPGRNLICHRPWCDTGARGRPCPSQENGRCPHFPEPAPERR